MKQQDTIIFTKLGYEKLLQEKEDLVQQRPSAVEDLAKARAMGDLSENGYYKSARLKLSFLDRQIRHLTYLIKNAQIRQKQATDVVDIESVVTIRDGKIEKTYTLVGGYESNPTKGKISIHSPLGKALMGKRKGDSVTVVAPTATKIYIIKSIS